MPILSTPDSLIREQRHLKKDIYSVREFHSGRKFRNSRKFIQVRFFLIHAMTRPSLRKKYCEKRRPSCPHFISQWFTTYFLSLIGYEESP